MQFRPHWETEKRGWFGNRQHLNKPRLVAWNNFAILFNIKNSELYWNTATQMSVSCNDTTNQFWSELIKPVRMLRENNLM